VLIKKQTEVGEREGDSITATMSLMRRRRRRRSQMRQLLGRIRDA
jgi:hypothetical protein